MTRGAVTPHQDLSAVRIRRAHLRRACLDLEQALAGAMAGRATEWAREVAAPVRGLREAFDAHVAITEGLDGLFDQVLADAPRLEPMLRRLHREHVDIATRLAAAQERLATAGQGTPETVREQLTVTLDRLLRHRQRGADLLYEAYQQDIGGE
jgi:hypothetical protein